MFLTLVFALATPALAAPAWDPDPNAAYADIPDDYKWDLTALFASDAAWEAEYDRVEAAIPSLQGYRGQLSQPRALYEGLTDYFELHSAASRLSLYAGLKSAVGRTDPAALAMEQRAQGLQQTLMDAAGFMRVEILTIPEKKMVKAYKKEPRLEEYRTYLSDILRRRDTVLGDEAEAVLALMGDNLWAEVDLNELHSPSEQAFRALVADMDWPVVHDEDGSEVQLNLSLYPRLRQSPDREVRREAVQAMFGTLRQYQDVFAATLGGQAETTVSLARARGYDTALEAYLGKDNIDPSVYENLVRTVGNNLEPLHRYVALRGRVMGVDKVHFYDMYVPLVHDVDREIPFDEARETIATALAPLGEDYLSVMREGMDPANGWIDVYPAASKISGAFSASTYGVHPYVMVNYQRSLDDMSTLAHEYGHAMHTYLSSSSRGYSDYAYVPFLAEIASTANEALLMDYLIEHAASDEERIYLLNQRAESIRGTIYRQAMFAEFEWEVHQLAEAGTPITASVLDELYAGLVQTYYGPSYVMDEDDGMEWAYIPHFYYKYYVFTYATGLSSGMSVAHRVKEDPTAVEGYLRMLSGGSSAPPLELLAGAGVDLTSPQPIEAALEVFDETITELEELLAAQDVPAEAPAEETE